MGGTSAVAARLAAASDTDPKNQLRRLHPASRAGDQISLMTCGSWATCDTVAMVVMFRPRSRKTNGTATLANPDARPNGTVRSAQANAGSGPPPHADPTAAATHPPN